MDLYQRIAAATLLLLAMLWPIVGAIRDGIETDRVLRETRPKRPSPHPIEKPKP